MKKVININFQGRVIPIEESAYEELKNYTDSLRRYFAKEEGRDEIINDIENRIAELFTERLKKNTEGCITDNDINEIIASIGRPEDFDGEGDESATTGIKTGASASSGSHSSGTTEPRGSLYRSDNDKILGGVCSGLASYLRIDPTIVRILFALITFGGFGSGVLLYIILWIVLPSKSLELQVRRRLYRNPDEKVIGGVCSGIASYFNIGVWIPRLIFTLPFFISILGNIFGNRWGVFHDGPDVIFGSFGGTLFVTYIILWMVVPFASTASEKLEMRGEKVDLESIKNTIQEELQGVKGRSEKWGEEFKERATQWGEEVKEGAKQFSAGAGPVARTAGNSFGHAVGVLFKAFFLFIAGVIVFALFIAFMAIIFSGIGVFPLKNFVLDGFWQNATAWGTLLLFFGVPIVASVIWLIRRISGVKSKNNYLGYIFGTLWIFGWVSVITLAGLVTRQFKRTGNLKEDVTITQPTNNKLQVDLGETYGRYYDMAWFDDNNNDLPALSADEDSMLLNTVRIRVVKSKDAEYHTSLVKLARGNSPLEAEKTASQISFPIKQNDSILYLPKGFGISKESKFRNQQVLVVIEVPVGKAIRIDHSLDWYSWFDINAGRRGLNIEIDDDYFNYNDYSWRNDIWYVMTDKGLERMDKKDRNSNDKDESGNTDDWNKEENKSGGEYRYRKDIDSIDIKINKKDTTVNIKLRTEVFPKEGDDDNQSDAIVAKKVKSSSYGKSLISVLDLLKVGS
jgi:phage shock protein PspC (stress-responsive transcriptional regulator)